MTVSIISANHRKQLTWRRRVMLAAAAALAAGTIIAEVVFSVEPPPPTRATLPYGAKPKSASSTRLSDYIQKSSRRSNPDSPAPAGKSLSDRPPTIASPVTPTLTPPEASLRLSSPSGAPSADPPRPEPEQDDEASSDTAAAATKIDRRTGAAVTTDVPTSDSPTSDSPTSDSPTSDSPTSDSPTSDSPTTDPPPSDSAAREGLFQAPPVESMPASDDDVVSEPEAPSEPREFGGATELELDPPPMEESVTAEETKPVSPPRDEEPSTLKEHHLQASISKPAQRVLRVIGMRERAVETVAQNPLTWTPSKIETVEPRPAPAHKNLSNVVAHAHPPVKQTAQEVLAPPVSEPQGADDQFPEAPLAASTPRRDGGQPAKSENVRRSAGELAWRTAQAANGAQAAPEDELPFDVIETSGELKVTMRRSKLLVLKKDVSRIAIVDPNIADLVQFTPRELSVIGKSVGATNVTFWFDDENQRPMTYLLTVEPDVRVRQQIEEDYRKLEGMISELFPDSLVRLVPMADKLIVKGQAKDAEEAAQILSLLRNQAGGGGGGGGGGGMMGMGLAGGIAAQLYNEDETGGASRPQIQIVNMLRVPGVHQVALRVKIAELNRTAARNFGIGVGGTANFTSNPQGSQLFVQSMLGLATGGVTGGAAAPTFLAQFDGDDIRVGIRYMTKAGVLRLLSEPTLVTLSGQPATFVAGGEFAVPTLVGSVGLNSVTTDFRSFGALISFVPTIVDKDRIRLQVSPEFSQINSALTNTQTGVPGLNVRRVTTTVEMREGQTFAIAGLLEDTMKSGTGSDIPFLHKIFGAREVNRTETELIILVTPELVHAMEPEEVPPLPGFDVTEPSNHQFYLRGDIEGTPTRDWRSPVWPRLKQRYNAGGSSMISGPFGHGQ